MIIVVGYIHSEVMTTANGCEKGNEEPHEDSSFPASRDRFFFSQFFVDQTCFILVKYIKSSRLRHPKFVS